jgi:beta-N-acetylhexosaminidase
MRTGRVWSLVGIAIVVGCAKEAPPPKVAPKPAPVKKSPPLRPRDQLVGDRLIVGFPGTSLDRRTLRALREGKIAGILILKHNVHSVAQLAAVSRQARGATRAGGHPSPIIAIDHEGGPVDRLRGIRSRRFPSALSQARAGAARIVEIARAEGNLLRRCGINVNLAPVVDLEARGRGGVLASRAYGRSPADVTRYAAAFVRGMNEAGVQCIAKHYPGHGLTGKDSHHDLPRVYDRREVVDHHARPFRQIVEAGAAGIMLSHLVVHAIDPKLPASLSPKVVSHLRQTTRPPIIVTDSGGMGALHRFGGEWRRATLSLEAGTDIYLTTATVAALGKSFHMLVGRQLSRNQLEPGAKKVREWRRELR